MIAFKSILKGGFIGFVIITMFFIVLIYPISVISQQSFFIIDDAFLKTYGLMSWFSFVVGCILGYLLDYRNF